MNLDLETEEKVAEANALETVEKGDDLASVSNVEADSVIEKKAEADLAIVEREEEILLPVPNAHAMPI